MTFELSKSTGFPEIHVQKALAVADGMPSQHLTIRPVGVGDMMSALAGMGSETG